MLVLSYLARCLHLTPSYDPSLIIRDVAYFSGSDAHVNHKLDIFLPSSSKNLLSSDNEEESEKKVPIIVHVHGGAWVYGSRTNEWCGGPAVGRTCAKNGFVGIVISYRLGHLSLISFMAWSFFWTLSILITSLALRSWQLIMSYIAFLTIMYAYNFVYKVRIPVELNHMVDDVCRALVYIREHIEEHYPQADCNQIFLSGHSAGAHLISLLVLDKSYLERYVFPMSSIRGVITMSGVYTLANPTHDSQHNFRNLGFHLLYASNLRYAKGKRMREYSPITYIEKNEQLPPFLVMSARFEMGLETDARRFVERFRTYNHQVEYHVIGGMTTHGTIVYRFSRNDAHRHFFTFIRQNMK